MTRAAQIRLSSDRPERNLVGGKAAALSALGDEGWPIPPWFALTVSAFEYSLSPKQVESLRHTEDPAEIESILQTLQPESELVDQIAQTLQTICPEGQPVAVRSSAVDEDGQAHSFAGQLDSFLFVRHDQVIDRIQSVWRSAFSPRVMAYRAERGLQGGPSVPAVLVQAMVEAEASGVAFSANPVNGDRSTAVISAVPGLGTALVEGEAEADTWHVDPTSKILEKRIVHKEHIHRPDPGSAQGVQTVRQTDPQASAPCLTDAQAKEVAALVRRLAEYFGKPQDAEWAYGHGKLYLLQSRPITTLGAMAPKGTWGLWDNSNIVESYSGITTPMTFSFARHVYNGVYRKFCRLMGVRELTVDDHAFVFENMLGLIRGRVYYNMLNWYRVLAMLPGFTSNRAYMEQMMGVREGLPEPVAEELQASTWSDRWVDRFRLAGMIGRLVAAHWTIGRRIRNFTDHFNQVLIEDPPEQAENTLDAQVHRYRQLERRLLNRWDAPLVNDFLAMIFFGTLRKLTQTWCGDEQATLQNNLLCGEGGIVSLEPAKRIRRMAQAIALHPELTEALRHQDQDAALASLQAHDNIWPQYQDYLRHFSDRCLEELKLESLTLEDNPMPLLRAMGESAQRIAEGKMNEASGEAERRARLEAENEVRSRLGGHPIRKMLFGWVLKHARGRVRDRENLRFERTRLFGRIRRILLESGRHLHDAGLLDSPRDIFYLELHEWLGFSEGTTTTVDLQNLVRTRQAQFDQFKQQPPPADRFETLGAVHLGNRFEAPVDHSKEPLAEGELKGIGCCSGVVRAAVQIITDPTHARLEPGRIMVAERTDPGWIMLFPAASGVLVERGSLLSHSAIVAREMSIPTIVSVPGLLKQLTDGQMVEMDGATGMVQILDIDQEA